MFNRFKVTQKQSKIITQQKHVIEERHKEITDSINYAERIQRSMLATNKSLTENLKEHFVLFKPKDVVSGDFYWTTKLANNYFVIATADSTGHGVPGAIMSMMNMNSLKEVVKTGYTKPHDILNYTRDIIIETLKNDGSVEGGKDGMDCSLCVYDLENMKLFTAAANNPIWIVRDFDGSETKVVECNTFQQQIINNKQLIEIKPDKMPVGKHTRQDVPFTLNEINLQKGDIVYTLTDGFPDQFGGNRGKKFMIKNLRELLLSNAHLPMAEQKQLLEQTFTNWTGNLDQVDDVTIIGVKI
jgi:serine phosphatase RsbU (regulator of sigma subunit)